MAARKVLHLQQVDLTLLPGNLMFGSERKLKRTFRKRHMYKNFPIILLYYCEKHSTQNCHVTKLTVCFYPIKAREIMALQMKMLGRCTQCPDDGTVRYGMYRAIQSYTFQNQQNLFQYKQYRIPGI